METTLLARYLILAGLALVALGLVIGLGGRLGLGRLPGDVVIRGEHSTVFIPITTCLVLSVGLSLLMWLWRSLAR
ncbi:MAG: DUF2905 family protein [Isosphaeraceae bacterium]